ncbi:MAG: hypothetical protein FWC26_03880 [Fibromonadales bacterium]|nr:hypothetical protein [Fibromonadales bacterium]
MTPEENEIIKSCCEDFKNADIAILKVKSCIDTEVIPAVLHLRYAGWHLSEGIINKEYRHLHEAKTHSEKAVVEAYRFGILYYLDVIKLFRDIHGKYISSGTIPNYSEKMRVAEEIRVNYMDKEYYYQHGNSSDSFLKLKSIVDELINSQPELNKLRVKNKIKVIVSCTISIVAIIIAILSIIFK